LLGLRLGDYGKDFHSRSGYIVEDTHVVDPKTILRPFNAAQALYAAAAQHRRLMAQVRFHCVSNG
jgi:hypothetical protein